MTPSLLLLIIFFLAANAAFRQAAPALQQAVDHLAVPVVVEISPANSY